MILNQETGTNKPVNKPKRTVKKPIPSVVRKPVVLPKNPLPAPKPAPPSDAYDKTKAITTAGKKSSPKINPGPKSIPSKTATGTVRNQLGQAGLDPKKYTGTKGTGNQLGQAGLDPGKYTNKTTSKAKAPAPPTGSVSKGSSGGSGGSGGGSTGAKTPVKTTTPTKTPTKTPSKDPADILAAQRLNNLWSQATGYQGQIDTMMKDGFHYDPATDPSYKALSTLAAGQAKVASKGAMETMNDRGILNSTVTSDRLGQIEQTAQDAVIAQVPALQQQAYGQYSDKIHNLMGLWDGIVGQAQEERTYQTQKDQWNKTFTTGNAQWQKDFDHRSQQDSIHNSQWQQNFDHGVSQDNVNNGFEQDRIGLSEANYTLDYTRNLQDQQGTTDAANTQAAISEILGTKNAKDARAFLQSKSNEWFNNGVSLTKVLDAVNKMYPGFKEAAGKDKLVFK